MRRQVPLKTPWINLRAHYKEEHPFPSDDWYFTFHTITAHRSSDERNATTVSNNELLRNAELKAFMSGFYIEKNEMNTDN